MAFVTVPVIKDENGFYPFLNPTDPYYPSGNPIMVPITSTVIGIESIPSVLRSEPLQPGVVPMVNALKVITPQQKNLWLNIDVATWASEIDALKIPQTP